VNRAVFLDRDGTLIDDPGFLADPAGVQILPGVLDALNRLQVAGVRRVVVTNQSGIGRGLLTPTEVGAVHAEIDRQCAVAGVSLDGWYLCPHRPEDGCACRKPGTLLHSQAAAALDLDLAASWCVGDRLSDVTAAAAIGGRAILVRTGDGRAHESAVRDRGIPVVDDLAAAVDLILSAPATTSP
jgi:D-glycero-D-manno-heptose 1,7-bisphosphate phosphatase